MRLQGALDLPCCKTHERHDRAFVARRTIETVSRLLGHTNIKTTQIYAKITAQKISQDMETLSHKLEDMEKNICRAI